VGTWVGPFWASAELRGTSAKSGAVFPISDLADRQGVSATSLDFGSIRFLREMDRTRPRDLIQIPARRAIGFAASLGRSVVAVTLQSVSVIVAAISAIAAAVSAWNSRKATERGHLPFVWPSISLRPVGDPESRQHVVGVQLFNDGAGGAFDVRFTIATKESLADPCALYVVPPIRAMRPGEAVPPSGDVEEQLKEGDTYRIGLSEPLDSAWGVVTRFADDLGRQWQLTALADPHSPLEGPVRLRTHRLELWRPPHDW
jgi:hypothetical protein